MPVLLDQDADSCAALVRRGCGADAEYRDAPLMMGLTVGENNTLPQVDQDVAVRCYTFTYVFKIINM